MTTEEDFQKALDAHPDDWQTRLVFADWLEERGDERATGMRALGVCGFYPFDPRENFPSDTEHCPWFGNADAVIQSVRSSAYLPGNWFLRIALKGRSSLFAPDHDYRRDATRLEVEDAAALAFARLPADRRAALLSGEAVPA